MKCASCEKDITSGFFKETEEGMMCLCADCLLRYNQYRKIAEKHRGLDCIGIYEMHLNGFGDRSISTYFGTNPFVVNRIVKEMKEYDRFSI